MKPNAGPTPANKRNAEGAAAQNVMEVDSGEGTPPTSLSSSSSSSNAEPFDKYFSAHDGDSAGGRGDCAYTAIAKASAWIAGKPATEEQLAPGGPLQAKLRVIAADELKAKPLTYAHPGDNTAHVGGAGTPANTIALSALATAAKTEFRIWALSGGQWTLHIIQPSGASKRPKTDGKGKAAFARHKIVWLRLEDKHYKWLKPRETTQIPSEVEANWVNNATIPPLPSDSSNTVLLGRGKGSAASVTPSRRDACSSILGLRSNPSVTSRRSVGHTASSVLGLQRSAARSSAKTKPRGTCTSVLGLKRQGTPLLINSGTFDYVSGRHLACKCGWQPPLVPPGASVHQRISHQAMQRAAKVHWKSCQGELPPPMPKPLMSEFKQAIQRYASEIKPAQAIAKYKQWLKDTPRQLVNAAHDLDLGKANFVNFEFWGYWCKRCSQYVSITNAKRRPCPARTNGVKAKDFAIRLFGTDKYNLDRAKQRSFWSRNRDKQRAHNRRAHQKRKNAQVAS